jgi:xanthine dehydrogenase YagS FAD-binding subunit
VGENQFHALFGAAGTCFIVHPSDTAPALVALGAEVQIVGPAGKRTIPVADLHVPPAVDPTRETVLEAGEVVTRVLLPAPPEGLVSSYRKVRARRAWDFALAGVALALAFDGDVVRRARVVLSGAAPVPWRAKPVERAITGKRLDPETIAAAAAAAVEGAEPLEHNGYKVPLFKAVVAEELEAIRPG